jgi:hydrogenase-4 component F
LEAAWKYIIICTVGIVLALFGIVLLYLAAIPLIGGGNDALNWTVLMQIGHNLDPKLVKLAFVFILVGYGTKVGLAPMHTWLPDAHSQAPSPVSAMLSGVLLNCAFYGILRIHMISSTTLGSGFSSNLLLIFGIISVATALPFIMIQKDIKRLLAYSSIEHMGIIAAAVGIGGKLGVFGAFLHMLNHALTKSTLFFAAGNVTQHYRTKRIDKIRGTLTATPVSGTVLLLGLLAIAGAPPFSIFLSEVAIFSAGFLQERYWETGLMLALIALAFAGIIHAAIKMSFGAVPNRVRTKEKGILRSVILIVPLCLVLILGVYIPPPLEGCLEQIVHILGGQ